MRRRDFLAVAAATAAAWPLVAHAQPAKVPRVGVLWQAGDAVQDALFEDAFRQGLRDAGYVENRDVVLINLDSVNLAETDANAAALVAAGVNVIVAVSTQSALAAQKATATIPIVFALVADPIGSKLVDSLAHPGGNITGLSNALGTLIGKQMALFKDAVPTLSRVALLLLEAPSGDAPTSTSTSNNSVIAEAEATAGALGLMVRPVIIRQSDDIEAAFSGMAADRIDGVFVPLASFFTNHRERLAELAIAQRLPMMGANAMMTDAGGLMSYRQDDLRSVRKAFEYVDLILKGAKPRDLPVEQPREFNLVINLKTAKAIGLTIPPLVLFQARRVIE
jgi:putative ABC transport system substrate-binding protein